MHGAEAIVSEARDTAGVTTRLILSYVRRKLGDEGVARLLDLAGEARPVAVLEDERAWSSYEAKIALFDAAERLTGDPLVARHIGESVLEEQLAAPVRLLVGALGSPHQVLKSVAKANVKFSTNSQMRCLESRPGRATVTYGVVEGYIPHRHDCLYTQGILAQVPALFGLPPASIDEVECQVEGASVCRHVVTWSPRRSRFARDRHARELLRQAEIDALREQVTDLQETVADLVASDELDEVLGRIASRASAAVRGQRFLLAVQLDGEEAVRIHSDGLDEDVATRLGAKLLADAGTVGPQPDVLVSEVASATNRYGRLAAYLPKGSGFYPAEQAQLDAYARLAATALDSATALSLARGNEQVSEALLELTHRLAKERSEASIAQLVTEAVPSVIGATSSSLRLWDEQQQTLRVAAVHGLAPERAAQARSLELTPDLTPDLQDMIDGAEPRFYTAEDEQPFVRQQLEAFGYGSVAVAPIVARGEFLGVVFANWDRDDTPPRHDTLFRGLTGLADQAGLALTSVRLLERTRHQATHDALTGLANRVLFHEHLEAALAASHRSGTLAAVCYLDLDGFKSVNDTRGHAVGDELLVSVAERLRATVRTSDGVARLAGDEFAVLLREVGSVEAAGLVAGKLVDALAEPYTFHGEETHIGASVGVALAPIHGETPDDLLRAADAAMYEAKQRGSTHRIRQHAGVA
jgi:diguanylate cyclase (GGDEF)-like protein